METVDANTLTSKFKEGHFMYNTQTSEISTRIHPRQSFSKKNELPQVVLRPQHYLYLIYLHKLCHKRGNQPGSTLYIVTAPLFQYSTSFRASTDPQSVLKLLQATLPMEKLTSLIRSECRADKKKLKSLQKQLEGESTHTLHIQWNPVPLKMIPLLIWTPQNTTPF